jgi:hypothetical protein
MHFVKHPHLRPTGIPPPPTDKPLWQKLAERLKRDGLFILYGAICVAIVAILLYGLLAPSN